MVEFRRIYARPLLLGALIALTACATTGVAGDRPAGERRAAIRTDEPILAVGFSNARREVAAYIAMGGNMINGAFSGCGTNDWAGGRGRCWRQLRRLNADPRVIWLKISHPRAGPIEALADDCVATIDHLRQEFPRLEVVYVSGRTYAGWGDPNNRLSPEPYARQTWEAVTMCAERSPLAEEGPWLWYDDWPRSYYARDGIHPSEEGSAAVARILADFFGD